MTTQASPQASRPEPKCALLVTCVECGEGAEVPLPTDHQATALVLARRGWFMSVISPPGQGAEVPILFAALCSPCAQKVYPAEVYKVAEERRQQMLASKPR